MMFYRRSREAWRTLPTLPCTAIAFLGGASASILAGDAGRRIAVSAGTKTTFECCRGADLQVAVKGEVTAREDLKAGSIVLPGTEMLLRGELLPEAPPGYSRPTAMIVS